MPPARTSKSSIIWARSSPIRCSTPRSPPWCAASARRHPTKRWHESSPMPRSTNPPASPIGAAGRLTARQLEYALADVTHLCVVYEALAKELKREGRHAWVEEEMAALQDPELYRLEPADAWKRLKARYAQQALSGAAGRHRRLARARGAGPRHAAEPRHQGRGAARDRRPSAGDGRRARAHPRGAQRLCRLQARQGPDGGRGGGTRGRTARAGGARPSRGASASPRPRPSTSCGRFSNSRPRPPMSPRA